MEQPGLFDGIIGRPEDPEPADEVDHFYVCKACGQAVDYRKLGQVFHHEVVGHEPIELDA